MRLTLQRKIFLAAWILSTATIVILVTFIRLNLGQSFERYTVSAELSRLDWLVRNVQTEYARFGSWGFIERDPERRWRELSRPHRDVRIPRPMDEFGEEPNQRPPPRRDFDGDRPPPPEYAPNPPADRTPPPNDPLNIGPRLVLADAEGHRLAGASKIGELSASLPIHYQGEVVGQVFLNPSEAPIGALDDAFLSSQTKSIVGVAVLMLALALLLAWALVRYLIAPINDLTEGSRRIAEGKLKTRLPIRTHDEFGELAQNFNRMVERLEHLETTRRNWISDASHELRTPLAVLRAEIEALQDGIRPADTTSFGRLHKQVQQLSSLVDDLRQTLDQRSGETLMDRMLFSPLEVLEEVLGNFEQRYELAHLRIERVGFNDMPYRVRGDAGRLHQVFTNLLENTLRYTDAGGLLSITLVRMDQWLLLNFEDTAPAPSRNELPYLFDRFFRSEPSRNREHGGSGLGLSICKSLIESHGGEISGRLSSLGGLGIFIKLPIEKC